MFYNQDKNFFWIYEMFLAFVLCQVSTQASLLYFTSWILGIFLLIYVTFLY